MVGRGVASMSGLVTTSGSASDKSWPLWSAFKCMSSFETHNHPGKEQMSEKTARSVPFIRLENGFIVFFLVVKILPTCCGSFLGQQIQFTHFVTNPRSIQQCAVYGALAGNMPDRVLDAGDPGANRTDEVAVCRELCDPSLHSFFPCGFFVVVLWFFWSVPTPRQ